MILIGQYDSPFVRRVGLALRLLGQDFEHRPWSVFGDADKVRAVNPVTKVPTLQLDDGDVIIESHMMLDFLDGQVSEDRRLFPAREPERHRALKTASLGMGMAEKAVSLFYEKVLHGEISEVWATRCESQIRATAAALESQCPDARSAGFFHGETMGNADIAVAVAWRFVNDAHPGLLSAAGHPRLAAFCARLEALPVFMEISQAFVPPK